MGAFHLILTNSILTSFFVHHCTAQTPTPTLAYETSDGGCHAGFPSVGASFNLCPLDKTDTRGQLAYYKVQDSRNVNTTTTSSNDIYTYYFNIASKVQSNGIPLICANSSYSHFYCPPNANCTDHLNTVPIPPNTAWAYQVKYDNNRNPLSCWALSNDMSVADWQLIEESDPSLGVQLTYTNGDYDDIICKNNRKFNIRFECEDNILFIPDEIPLYEYSPCEYTLSVASQYGCPIQCNIYDDQLCDSNGLCGYDSTNQAPRCFCYNTYTNDDCSVMDPTAGIPENSAKEKPSNPFVFEFKNALGTGVDVIYDLGAFGSPESKAQENGGVYIVHDEDFDNDNDRTWTYFVAISTVLNAQTSDLLPDFCKGILGPCMGYNSDGSCASFEAQWNGIGLVFQANNVTKECFVLGRYTNGSPSADLFDQIDDPARGVTVTYSEGSWCEEAKRNREFRVNLVCPRDHSAVYDPYEETSVDVYGYVEEESICVYSFTMESAVACPFQCITDTTDAENMEAFTVCSQKGICAADPQAGFVRCLCDDGYKGVYCTQIDSPMPTEEPTAAPNYVEAVKELRLKKIGFVVGIVILVIVIVVVLVIGFVVYRNQKLKISEQETELQFQRMNDTVQTNIVTDEKGKTGFATIATNTKIGNDSD